MKTIYIITFLFVTLSMAMLSCEKEQVITGSPSPLVSLADVRSLYKEMPLVLKAEDMLGATSVCGIVISDPTNGNSPDGLVILQGYRRKQLRGVALALGEAASKYHAGDSLVVKVEGGTLERVNGILQISGIAPEAVTKIAEGKQQRINIAATTFSNISSQMNYFESTLVQLKSAVTPGLQAGQTFAGDIELSDWANSILLHTKAGASFATAPVPGLGDFTGIALADAAQKPVLWMRSADDYIGQSLEPYYPGGLYANFPEGWENHDGPRKSTYGGTSDIFPSGEWLMPNMYSLNSTNIVNKNGTWAVMMRNGQAISLAMNYNLPYGASKFSFYYGAATLSASDSALPITVKVEYSQDSGNSWQQIENDLTVSSQSQKYYKEYTLSIKGPVRFRISKDASAARLFVDDIAVYQN